MLSVLRGEIEPEDWQASQHGENEKIRKAAGARFSIGDAARERRGARIGKIVGIRPSGIVEILLSDGIELNCQADDIEPVLPEAMLKAADRGQAIPF